MRQRVVTMIAVAALLIVGAAPALAAPGGVPGPPADHVKGADDVAVDDAGADMHGPPEWAKAYGWRIKDAFDMPYGHLVQCNKEVGAYEDWDCPTDVEFPDLEFPEDNPGAKAFWEKNESIFAI